MKKVKSLISFVGRATTAKGKLTLSFVIFLSLLEFPAFIFHEIMHLLIAVPFGWNLRIKEWYFFVLRNQYSLMTYRLTLQYTSTPLIGIIGSAAPLIGWILAVILLSITGHWFILLYFFLGIRMFFLSEQDILCMHSHGFNEKICTILLKVQKKLGQEYNVNVM